MNWYHKTCLLTFAATMALAIYVAAIAQQSADIAQPSADLVSPDQTGSTGAPQTATATQTASGTSPDADLTDKQRHYYGMAYIWFPGIHGTHGQNVRRGS
jgi:hypothetical protein